MDFFKKEANFNNFLFLLAIVQLLISALYFSFAYSKQVSASEKTAAYFLSIKDNPKLIHKFLHDMPKGGDLHMHIGGSETAENFVKYAVQKDFCIDRNNFTIYKKNDCSPNQKITSAIKDRNFYNQLINAWSMKQSIDDGDNLAYKHFFTTFKTDPILQGSYGDVLKDIVNNAANENISYIELQTTIINNDISKIHQKISYKNDFSFLYKELLKNGIDDVAKNISNQISSAMKEKNDKLFCNTSKAQSGCKVVAKYQLAVIRNLFPKDVFSQLLIGFILVSNDANFVGINLVGPEYDSISLRDYKLHMKMISFLHHRYPKVNISLHAGELIPSVVPAKDLEFHIRDAVNIGGASRVGHGLDLLYEQDKENLLDAMAKNNITVEIAPSSEYYLWGIRGVDHPMRTYLSRHVPIVLSTDDAGTLRTNLTNEFISVTKDYNFSYMTIKTLIRNSITYSFLGGKNLWEDSKNFIPVKICSSNRLGSLSPSQQCSIFLEKNAKAKLQWMLENCLNEFEEKYSKCLK